MMRGMKTWQETARVYGELARRLEAGQVAAVATLIRVVGSAYRRPGAKLLIGADGALVGNVSGGCLEEDLRERGLRALQTGEPELVHYDTGADENVMWGLGLGCNGQLDLWLQPYRPPTPEAIRQALAQLQESEPFTLIHPPGQEENPIFREVLSPPADLVVVGAGEDARPVVKLAAEAGFRVTVVDHRSAYLTAERFPDAHRRVLARPEAGLPELPIRPATLALLMTHSLKMDKAWAQLFAVHLVAYLGLLGPQASRDEILSVLPAGFHPKIHGPVGLDLGAEGAEQIAVSIVAELLAVQAGRSGGPLRERAKPLHG